MADSFTSGVGLRLPAANDPAWNTLLNNNFALIDGLGSVGPLGVALKENPSTSLNVTVAAGLFRKSDGNIVSYAGTSSQACTTAATNYLYLTDAGTLTLSTSSFPTSGNFVPLATVVAGATTITSVTDSRNPWFARGGHLGLGVGSPSIAAGTGAGSSPTLSIAGSDQAGLITVLTGSSPTLSAVVATVTFGMVFGTTPRMVSVRPANAAASALSGAGAVWADSGGLSTTVFTLNAGGTALAATTTYKWWYEVIG